MKKNNLETAVPKMRPAAKKLTILATCALFIYLLFPFAAQMQSEQEFIETESPQFLIGSNAGDLDPTFAGAGKVSLNLSGASDTGNAVTRQPDGKIIIIGDRGSEPCVVRYNTDGSLDQTFGNDTVRGIACLGLGSSTVSDVFLQPDGKIIIIGAYNVVSGDRYSLIARFNTDGTLDTTFSNNGRLEYSINGGDDYSLVGLLQADGKILLGGKMNDVSSSLVRINADGSVDATFGSGGYIGFDYSGYSRSLIYGLAIDSAGRIVVGGYGLGSNYDYVFARLTSTGSFDSTFVGGGGTIAAGTGKIAVQTTANDDYLRGMVIQPDGKIVGVGRSLTGGSNYDLTMVRLNGADGSLDATFDTDGKVQTNFGGLDDNGNNVALQSDGKIVVCGLTNSVSGGSRYDFAIARYNTNGLLDTSFDGDGKLTTQINNNNSDARDIVIQPDGKIVAAGFSNWATVDFSVARYNPNGSLDTSWGNGKKPIEVNTLDDHAESVAQQADGKLVVAGRTLIGGNYRFGLTRFNTDGTLDTAGFGTGGKVSTALVNSDYGYSVAIQPADQKIVVGGSVFNGAGDWDFLIARYNTNGSLDTSFGTSGFVRRHNSSDDQIYAIALLSDGDIVAVGSTIGGNIDIAVLRFDVATNGWDPAFGTSGLRIIANANSDVANDVKIDSNGKIVIGGFTAPSSKDFILMRLNGTNGTNDAAFNGGNVLVQQINGFDEEIRAVTVQSDGKIVVAGYADTGANGRDFVVARYTSAGVPDTTFDFDGKQITTFSSSSDVANGVAIQSDGKILASGYAYGGAYDDNAVARYNSDGSLDTAFGSNGKRTYDFSGYHDYGNSNLLIQSDGKAVSVGEAHNGINWDFGVIRILTNSAVDCSYSLSQTTQASPQAGGSFSVNVTTTSGCTWTAVSNVSWLNFTGSTNGTGNGAVAYSVDANPGSISRSGTITIGGQVLTVTQYGSNVAVSIPTNLTGQNGATLTVPLSVSDTTGQGILSYDFTLTYDQTVLTPQVTPYDKTGTLSSGFTVTVNPNTPGTLVVSGFGTSALAGAGTLLNLKFTVAGTYPACSGLNFTAFTFNAGIPPNQTSNGQFCVINGNISGTIVYVNGSPTQPAVQNAAVTAVGSTTITGTTNSSGYYELTGFSSGAYTVTPTKTTDVNGISALDASLVAQHVVGLITLTSAQQTAGDTNNNGALNSFDAALIAQYAVAISNPASIAGTWKFSPASRNYASVITDTPNQNYNAILVGEVTGNWTPPPPFAGFFKDTPILVETPIAVSFPNTYGSNNSIINIPIVVGKDLAGDGVFSYELDFNFDPLILEPQTAFTSDSGTLSNGMAVTVNNSTPGRSRIAVFGTAPLSGQGTLLNLRFRVIGAPGQVSPLNWTTFFFNEGNPNSAAGNGQVTVLVPTSANVSVSGRIATANGNGIRNVRVTLTDANGNLRTATTGSFGNYHFDGVPVGAVYTISVLSKKYSFDQPTRVLSVTDELTDVDFTAIE